MSVATLIKTMRPRGRWTQEARMLYTTRRFIAFFEKYPDLVSVALGDNPSNRVLWDGLFRFFFRHFPTRTDTYIEYGNVRERSWWYNEETFDPKWDWFMREYKASLVFSTVIIPYLKHQKGEA